MTDESLRDLARRAGIAVEWTDAADQPQTVAIETLRGILHALGLPCASSGEIADSTERLQREWVEPDTESLAAADPAYGIDDIDPDGRLWGLAVQLYGLRREGDGGIGDFGGAVAMAKAAAPFGADALALSPVHALFAARPDRYSPYAPSSRLFLNPLLADPSLVFGREHADGALVNRDALIDWPARSREKLARFQSLFNGFQSGAADHPLRADFERFQAEKGEGLRLHALFELLDARFETGDWRRWPVAWRDPVRAMANLSDTDRAAMRFPIFLQWVAHRSLSSAQAAAQNAGLRIGLIADLAVGADPSGSDAWCQQTDMLTGLSVGAPPDLFNPIGQNWGLTALSPRALASNNHEPFIELLRANMACAGGIRIDHAMGLRRLWLIPDGAAAHEGAYLTYPFETLLRLIAIESRRHRAVVIAEDLGTVPPGFGERLNQAGILGMRILWFERDGARFKPPGAWRRDAVAMTSTHDLPTVTGWWRGDDITTREAVGFYRQGETAAEARSQRRRDRAELWQALVADGCANGDQPPARSTNVVAEGAVRFVARTPSRLALVPLEDIVGENDQPNLPGTIAEHPNWRRRQKATSDKLLAAPKVAARLTALKQERSGR